MRSFRAILAGCLLVCSCSTNQKAGLVNTALDDKEAREEYFEATLRVLDAHPEYTDELFAQAQKHPKTLDRFLSNAANHLDDEALARATAKHLVHNPEGIRQVLLATLDAAKEDPAARQAIARAIEERSDLSAQVISDRPPAVEAMLEATVAAVADKPEARAAFLRAMQKVSPALAAVLAKNPKTLKAMTKALVGAAYADKRRDIERVLEGE
jgi:hypothetical protein